MPLSRRDLIAGGAFASAAVLLGACSGEEEPVARSTQPEGGTRLEPTPTCGDDHGSTPEQTEGPYYTPDTPKRTNLVEPGVPGDRLVIAGTVLGTDCRPIAGALLDFWQADGEGVYDNEGFRLRGHQFTDRRGRFVLTTVAPGLYPGRTRHLHVKVQRPHGEVLTTQLYFPGEAQNDQDGIFDEALVMDVKGSRARYDFVLA
jgi:protocatechuate 3,4-dioxygenase beta subunit